MLLTREADNAVRIVFCLAAEQKKLGAAEIAEKVNISQRFALKTMHKLVGAGFVKSYKGQSGGYALNCCPKEVSMYDVISAIDGPCFFSRCLDGEHGCGAESCRFRDVYSDISGMINDKLKSITFEDLLNLSGEDLSL